MIMIPLVDDRDDSASVNADLLPSRLGHVEVLERRVAPSAIVVRQSEVGWAEIGRRHRHRRPFHAPPWIRLVIAHDLEALPARCAVVEQRRAQRRRPRPVPSLVQVPVPTSSACNRRK